MRGDRIGGRAYISAQAVAHHDARHISHDLHNLPVLLLVRPATSYFLLSNLFNRIALVLDSSFRRSEALDVRPAIQLSVTGTWYMV